MNELRAKPMAILFMIVVSGGNSLANLHLLLLRLFFALHVKPPYMLEFEERAHIEHTRAPLKVFSEIK